LNIYWQERRAGLQLVLDSGDGEKVILGAVRKTPRGYDAFATTTGYDPGRATKGLATLEEAKAFVLSFEPWNLFEGAEEGLPIEPAVRPMSQ
jgi:hypothetical protein